MAGDKLIVMLQQVKLLVEEAIRELEGKGRKTKKIETRLVEQPATVLDISFNTNALAFMKRYARGLSGPQKFTLLLARLVEGNVSKEVSSAELERQWNKMKVILDGKFNPAYANRAKANGWVDAPKHGVCTLSHSWKAALAKAND